MWNLTLHVGNMQSEQDVGGFAFTVRSQLAYFWKVLPYGLENKGQYDAKSVVK